QDRKKLNSQVLVSISLSFVTSWTPEIKREAIQTMKRTYVLIALSFLFAVSALAAEDGATLYKAKCSQCHGTKGEGKSAMKAPPVAGSADSADQIEQLITQGAAGKKAPHGKAIAGLNAGQAKAVADYVKTLQ